jgi:HTH-type transcriptional regulator/antitoxin HipB
MDIIRIPAQLGTVLRAARHQQGLTQADVAKRLGVSIQAVSKLENNAGRAAFERVHKLCLLLGLEVVLRPKDGIAKKQKTTSEAEW